MFFKDDFNHLSPNFIDNSFLLTEKFKKFLRKGSEEQVRDRLEKKKARLDKVKAEKAKLVKLSYPQRIDPNDPVVGTAGALLSGVDEVERAHLRDIDLMNKKLDQLLTKD